MCDFSGKINSLIIKNVMTSLHSLLWILISPEQESNDNKYQDNNNYFAFTKKDALLLPVK